VLRKLIHTTVNFLAMAKAKARNPRVEFGADCRVSWSARFFGMNPIVFGDRCAIRDVAMFSPGSGSIHFGADCSVGPLCYLDGCGGLWVGNRVRIGPHVGIYTANHIFTDADRPIMEQGLEELPVTIGDDVWIGSHAVILAGVEIGDHAVVAAGAVVTRNVPPFHVVAGVPARTIKCTLDQPETSVPHDHSPDVLRSNCQQTLQ
jgi:acetyltransferase-like isoleucine patch superfamily enzyme